MKKDYIDYRDNFFVPVTDIGTEKMPYIGQYRPFCPIIPVVPVMRYRNSKTVPISCKITKSQEHQKITISYMGSNVSSL